MPTQINFLQSLAESGHTNAPNYVNLKVAG